MVTLSRVEMKCSGLGQAAEFFLGIGWENTLTGMWEETFALWKLPSSALLAHSDADGMLQAWDLPL